MRWRRRPSIAHHRPARTTLVALCAAALAAASLSWPATAVLPGDDVPRLSPGEAYEDLGFGVFMHYGLATFVGETPWSYDPDDVPATTYDPPDFDPDQWMDAIAASGAKYIILTTKHHDGFAMWDSDYTEYDVANSSDPDTDVVGEVVRAARERDLEVAFYYSWWDKMEPGGNVLGGSPPTEEYVRFAKNQMRELLTEYGPVVGLWLDIPTNADLQGLADFIHGVSPETAFIPNLRRVSEAEDVTSFEGPGFEMIPCGYEGLPAEQAYNVAGGPGWWEMAADAVPKGGVDEVVSLLRFIQQVGATLSLNVSPGPTGKFSAANVRLLEGIGDRVRGDDLLAAGVASASGAMGDHPASHAVDLQAKTFWQPPVDGAASSLRVDLDRELTLDRVVVQFTSDAVPGYEIQYRDVDGVWRTAHTGGSVSVPSEVAEFPAVTTDSLRLVLPAGTDTGVFEFKAYGGVDDTSASVVYDGSWQALNRPASSPQVPRLPPSVPFAGAFNQSVHQSRTAGDTATVTFTGNAVQLHATVGPDQGVAEVRVDGGEPVRVDLYRPERGRDVAVFERRALEPGEHTVTARVTGDRHDDATGSWVTFDRVTPLSAAPPFTPGLPYQELPDGRIAYDDTGDRCTANSPVEFSGPWQSGGWAGAFNATRHFAYQQGAAAELTFEGIGVAVMAQTRPGHGIAAISVDGGEPELVDTYSDPAREQVVVWEKTGLEPGEHTVRIEVTGDKSRASSNTWIGLDAVIVTPLSQR